MAIWCSRWGGGAPSCWDLPKLPHLEWPPIGSHDRKLTFGCTCSFLLQGLQEEGLDLGAQIESVKPLVQGNPTHQHKMDQLSADYQALERSLEVKPGPRDPMLSAFASFISSNLSFLFFPSFLPFLIHSAADY